MRLAATFLTVVLLGCVAQEIQSLLVLGLIPQRAYRSFYHLLVDGIAYVLGRIGCAGLGILHLHAFDKKELGLRHVGATRGPALARVAQEDGDPLSHFVEVSYSDEQGARGMDPALIDLAGKYYGGASGRGVTGDRRMLEFLFPHFEQASGFTADVRAYLPQVSIDRVA